MAFRRNQPAAAAVEFDHWAGDTEAESLHAELRAGRWQPVAETMAGATAPRRETLTGSVPWELDPAVALDEWVDATGSAVALTIRGSYRIWWAWDARGSGRASTVEGDTWEIFFERLRLAEADLWQAIRTDPADGVPWSLLLDSGRGLQIPEEELVDRYEHAVERAPGLIGAADRLLQGLCQKWSGSHERMFTFARIVAEDASDGDPRLALVPMAHFERAIEIEGEMELEQYRQSRDVAEEILAACRRCVDSPNFGGGPEERRALNTFAMALSYFHRHDDARPLYERIVGHPTIHPWSYFDDPSATWVEYRAKAGLQR